ncbi:MAG TPA: hypothetical protein DDW52_23555 [Planctomycetaceae bacterium]|nr:hypothetical protein [Planctomycetaceae bacterium]
MIEVSTNLGTFTIELYSEDAPISSANFESYVKEGHYDGTIFHRVIDGFMVQGGGFTPDMQQKPTKAPIENEGGNGVKNMTYSLAMARTSDPNSATCQFFVNVADNAFLDRANSPDGVGYAVFGKVASGTEVIDKIAKVQTGNVKGMGDVPTEPVVIETMKIVE